MPIFLKKGGATQGGTDVLLKYTAWATIGSFFVAAAGVVLQVWRLRRRSSKKRPRK